MDYEGKVAVITGGASGIGRALVEKCLELGMKVVISDINPNDLAKTAGELGDKGQILTVQTDVSKPDQVKTLADAAYAQFGAVHLLFNNAGVSDGRPLWESTPADVDWVLGVNVKGILYGIQSFVPRMMAQDEECYVVNTASLAGLAGGSGFGIYRASKHAAVSLSETLKHDLQLFNAKIRVAVLCPAWVRTGIVMAARNKPAEVAEPKMDEYGQKMGAVMMGVVNNGISPQQVAEKVFEALEHNRFYILTHPEMNGSIYIRGKEILEGAQPTDTFAKAYLK
jgi:NAD(P)-dependent dehydrogenase (short-subunit alcohol dehydrogenase family)